MRRSDADILAQAVVAAAVTLAMAGAGIWAARAYSTSRRSAAIARPAVTLTPRQLLASWPTWRGNSAASGVAEGELADDFQLAWRFASAAAINSSPVVADGRVYVGSDDYSFYCLDLATGRKLWSLATEREVAAPALVRGQVVYVASSSGDLFCLDAATGQKKWTFPASGKLWGAPNWIDGGAGERIILTSEDGKIYGLNSGGQELWEFESPNYVYRGAAVADGRIVAGGCDGLLHVLDASGLDTRPIEAWGMVAVTPAVAGERAYFGDYSGVFSCVDLASGEEVWSQLIRADEPIVGSAAVSEKAVVFGCDDNVYCLSPQDGRELWHFATRGEVASCPVICGDKVVVGSGDGWLYVLSLADGRKVWAYELGAAVDSSPAVAAGIILIGCADGAVYAFVPK